MDGRRGRVRQSGLRHQPDLVTRACSGSVVRNAGAARRQVQGRQRSIECQQTPQHSSPSARHLRPVNAWELRGRLRSGGCQPPAPAAAPTRQREFIVPIGGDGPIPQKTTPGWPFLSMAWALPFPIRIPWRFGRTLGSYSISSPRAKADFDYGEAGSQRKRQQRRFGVACYLRRYLINRS